MITLRQFAVDALAEPLDFWKIAVRQLHQEFDPAQITQRWIDGLRTMRVEAERAKDGRDDVDFGLEFPCPVKEHRSADGMRRARIRLRVEDDGWVTMIGPPQGDEETLLCRLCSQESIENWLLTCTRCVADEESDDHHVGHSLVWGWGSRSPLDYVLAQIERVVVAAVRSWMDTRPAEVIEFYFREENFNFDDWEVWEYDSREEAIEAETKRAQMEVKGWLEQRFFPYFLDDDGNPLAIEPPKAKAKPSGSGRGRFSSPRPPADAKPEMAEAEVIVYNERIGIPVTANVRDAWDLARKHPDNPGKAAIQSAQAVRNGRRRVPS